MEIWIGFILGLFGGIHCLGMCGPIVLALSAKNRKIGNWILYHLSRVLAYCTLGVMAGAFGASLKKTGIHESISLFAGALMLITILVFKVFNSGSDNFLFKKVHLVAAKLWKNIFQENKKSSWMLAGYVNGFLPCGFVYIALSGALAFSNVLTSMVYMVGFGLGTIPFLLCPIFLQKALPLSFRNKFVWLQVALPVILALLLILRGLSLDIPFISPFLSSPGGESCH